MDNGEVRVLAMVDRKEVADVTIVSHVARELFAQVVGAPSLELTRGYSIYLVPDVVSRNAFLEKHPSLAGRDAASMDGGARLGETNDVVRWDRMKDERLEHVTRHTLALFIERDLGLTAAHGWAYEGLQHYLADRLLRTRTTAFVEELEVAEDEERAQVDWNFASLALLSGDSARGISRLFTLRAEEMERDDVMLAHALTAFVLEGHQDVAPALLRRVGSDGKSAAAFTELLGMDARTLDRRLARWLRERD